MNGFSVNRERLQSLDVFRGATIALMILVNNPGDWNKTYAPLLHAAWHGCTPTDLVFPFFLFIVGVAIPFALSPPGSGPILRKIVRRATILLGLGLLLNFFPFYTVVLEKVRLPGVLQRIAVVYLCAALAYLYLSPRARVLLSVGLLAFYTALMKLVPVPGFGAGDLSPQGNLAFWLDHVILGSHTWRGSPGPGDPEGMLSTLPAIVTALLGITCGELLRSDTPARLRLRHLLLRGSVVTAAGLLLHPFFPLNKNLWSPSYTLFTAGLAMTLLAFAYFLIDLRPAGWAHAMARPFAIFGRNSILAFVGSGLLVKTLLVVFRWQEGEKTVTLYGWLYRQLYVPIFPDYVASLVFALTHVVFWLAILALLDRRGIFLKV